MRHPLLPVACFAAALWTASSASAQVQIDTSSADAVMASLAELHESWTHDQFLDFMRAAMMAGLPDEVENPASWQGGRNRWEFLPDTLAIFAGISLFAPLVLEGEPLFDYFPPEELGPWLRKFLSHGLEGRTIDALVRFGRGRERAVLVELRRQAVSALPELEEQVERAEADLARPGASTQDRYTLEAQARRLADNRVRVARLDRRLEELEDEAAFAPGAIGCDLDRRIDLSTEEAMLVELEALAETCPQQVFIRFLQAAAFLAEIPGGLAEAGARMDPAAVLRAKDQLRSAVQAILGLAALLQKDPFIRGVESIPGRLMRVLNVALEGRTISELTDAGERLERAFLIGLREELTNQLRSERQRQALERENAPPERPKAELKRLRVDIKRIDQRLAVLEARAPMPLSPGAN